MKKGQILENAVRKSHISVTAVAKQLGVSRTTIYNWFSDYEIDDSIFRRVGEVISYDFSHEIPSVGSIVAEELAAYASAENYKCKKFIDERNHYLQLYTNVQTKLTEVYENYIRLQEELRKLQLENSRLKNSKN